VCGAVETNGTAFITKCHFYSIALVTATNMIDGVWKIAIERADEAGKELAKSLIQSQAGHGQLTLMGYSMGE